VCGDFVAAIYGYYTALVVIYPLLSYRRDEPKGSSEVPRPHSSERAESALTYKIEKNIN
jgi:hypothetical protein